MTIQVRIPAVMRTNTAGEAVVMGEGSTVGEVLSGVVATYPSLKDVLFISDGELHKYVNIYVDSEDIRYVGGLEADVTNATELTILPAVAGG